MFRFLGFACVAALAVGFADYTTQAKAEGEAIGSFPISTYLNRIPSRISENAAAHDKAKRQAVPAKTHLPEAPAGWERRAWVRDVEAELQARLDAMKPAERALAEQVSNGFIGKMERKEAIKAAEKDSAAHIWEYAKGDETVRIHVRHELPTDGKDSTEDMSAAQSGPTIEDVEGFALIRGVPFFNIISAEAEESAPRYLVAFMGDAITLRVHAQASDDSIRLILGAVDYDSLNAMLDAPLPAVGVAAPTLTKEEESALLQVAIAARFAGQIVQATANGDGSQATFATPAAAQKPAKAAAKPASAPEKQSSRFKLSGGRECLAGGSGSLCKK